MRVTVITPSKNQGQYIDDCLRSIHEQTHRDIEHIVLDGMSTDETADVAARYPCKFLQSKDSGPAQAINRGLDMASGDIVCWLNADDVYWSNRVLERAVGWFAEFSEVDVITGNGYYIGADGKLLNPVCGRPERYSLPWMKRSDYILQPATFWRRNDSRLDESLHYCFDWKLWIDFWQSGLNVLFVPEYFARHRVHSSSLTEQDSALRRQEVYSMARRYDGRRLQIAWCWVVWRMYKLSESLRSPNLKRLARRANRVMLILSGGRFASC
jgi:glycosyltransferase involved in cell wall biosynthesis